MNIDESEVIAELERLRAKFGYDVTIVIGTPKVGERAPSFYATTLECVLDTEVTLRKSAEALRLAYPAGCACNGVSWAAWDEQTATRRAH